MNKLRANQKRKNEVNKFLFSWGFWARGIFYQFLAIVFADWFLTKVGLFENGFSLGEFLIRWLIAIIIWFVVVLLFVCFYSEKKGLEEGSDDFEKIERKVKKNYKLWSKIEAIRDLNSSNFFKSYPSKRKELINYIEISELKSWEREYVDWFIEYSDKREKEYGIFKTNLGTRIQLI